MNNRNICLLFFIILKLVIQYFAIDPVYELHRDEYLHIDLGKHLAWGYLSVPPITSWLSLIIISLGNSWLLVKIVPAIFGALTLLVVWKTVELLKGGMFALVLSASCILFSALIRINTLYQPNSLEYLMWTLVFYCLIRFISSHENKWLWIGAVSFALGFLNKYNIVFLAIGLISALLLSEHRRIFLNKHLYLAALLALVMVSPNLWWQFSNDFPVIRHLSELSDQQLVNVSRADFFKDQLFFFAGSLGVLLLAFVSFFRYGPFKKYIFILWCFLLTLFLYAMLRAKGYYALGLYPILIAFGVVYVEYLLSKGWWSYLKPILLVAPLLVMFSMYKLILPVLSPEEIIADQASYQRLGLLQWEDGVDHDIPQDFADMLGWEELAMLVDSALIMSPDPEHTLIHCDNYGQAGAINFYSKLKSHDALSMNADYIGWYPLDEWDIQHVILVQEKDDDDPERSREKKLFEKVIPIGSISNKFARESGASVYLLQGAKQSINDLLKEEILRKKSDYY